MTLSTSKDAFIHLHSYTLMIGIVDGTAALENGLAVPNTGKNASAQ